MAMDILFISQWLTRVGEAALTGAWTVLRGIEDGFIPRMISSFTLRPSLENNRVTCHCGQPHT